MSRSKQRKRREYLLTLVKSLPEAQHAIRLAWDAGFFDGCFPQPALAMHDYKAPGRALVASRLRVAVAQFLAGQYAKTRIEIIQDYQGDPNRGGFRVVLVPAYDARFVSKTLAKAARDGVA